MGDMVDALSSLIHDKTRITLVKNVKKLRIDSRQQFDIAIQAALGLKVIAVAIKRY